MIDLRLNLELLLDPCVTRSGTSASNSAIDCDLHTGCLQRADRRYVLRERCFEREPIGLLLRVCESSLRGSERSLRFGRTFELLLLRLHHLAVLHVFLAHQTELFLLQRERGALFRKSRKLNPSGAEKREQAEHIEES